MRVSRRDFVSTATFAAAASLCALPSSAFAAKNSRSSLQPSFALLDLKSNCALPESFAGMLAAVGESHRRILASDLSSSDLESVVIVPAAGSVNPETYRAVADSLERGTRVVWESGAAFLDPSLFAQQQSLAKRYFGISIEQPVDLWPRATSQNSKSETKLRAARGTRAIGHKQIPYVAYRWPCEAHVRDFSRVIPVSAPDARAIAHWEKVPVALSINFAAGSLIFLGSPLGTALRAGDADAQTLFHAILAQ